MELKPGQGPIIPHILLTGIRPDFYTPAPIRRVAVRYHSEVMLCTEETQAATISQHNWGIPDDAAWEELSCQHTALRDALNRLADDLRQRRYVARLEKAGGIKQGPNPLCPLVAGAADPDKSTEGYSLSPFSVPSVERFEVVEHKPKSLVIRTSGEARTITVRQAGYFAVADEEDWRALKALYLGAEDALQELQATLKRYGTYADARARYIPGGDMDTDRCDYLSEEQEQQAQEALTIVLENGYSGERITRDRWVIWRAGMQRHKDGKQITFRELLDLAKQELEVEEDLQEFISGNQDNKAQEQPQERAVLHHIPPSKLRPHPDNPRLALREEVVDGLAAQIETRGGFSAEYALLVRPIPPGGEYQIISGHHRLAAAIRAGVPTVPCWVRRMTDDQAYLELGMANTQGELSPLEVGLHAYGAVELGKGGKGISGGLSGYAKDLGRTKGYISQLVAAAQVYRHLSTKGFTQVNSLEGKTKHLYEVSRAPQEQWAELATEMLENDWSSQMVRAAVEELMTAELTEEELTELRRTLRRRGGQYIETKRYVGAIRVTNRYIFQIPIYGLCTYSAAETRNKLPDRLANLPEIEERLPPELAATWSLEERGEALVARHQPTGIELSGPTILRIVSDCRLWRLALDDMHNRGWRIRRDGGFLFAIHPDYGQIKAPGDNSRLLHSEATHTEQNWRKFRARALIEQMQWDEAERVIAGITYEPSRNAIMFSLKQAREQQVEQEQVEEDAPVAAPAAAPQYHTLPERETQRGQPPARSSPPATNGETGQQVSRVKVEMTVAEIRMLYRAVRGDGQMREQAMSTIMRIAAERGVLLPLGGK